MLRFMRLILLSLAISSAAHAGVKPLKAGHYQLGASQIQQICLKGDGSWYGTTFNFGGNWGSSPFGAVKILAAIHGNYTVQGHDSVGYANDTITVLPLRGGTITFVWYDWYDDFSFQNLVSGEEILFIKKNCDPPFKGENTHAATE